MKMAAVPPLLPRILLNIFLLLPHLTVAASPYQNVTKVYLVFSNHLDVGYTDNLNGSCAGAVVNRYFHDHFPKAAATAAAFRKEGKGRAYRWMSQSWLVSVFRHCASTPINIHGAAGEPSSLICPNATALADFEAAAKRGDIGWHAFPFNAEPEMLDRSLFDAGLDMTFEADDWIGHQHRQTLSQRDVPGLTRAAIPLLRARGVKAVTVGENGACAPVAVPKIFRWADNASQTEVLAMYHPRGYGRRRRRRRRRLLESDDDDDDDDQLEELIQDDDPFGGPSVFYDESIGAVRFDRDSDCAVVPAAGRAVCYAWNSDNKGPHDFQSASAIFDSVERGYPGATVVASDAFDDFVADVWPHLGSLPVVTAEIGDTWIYGASTDPLKVAWYRAAARLRAACLAGGDCTADKEPRLADFDRLLIKVSEHTWGWNDGSLRSPKDYGNDALAKSLATDAQYQTAVLTWLEQRSFLPNAVRALGADSALREQIEQEFEQIAPRPFDATGFEDAPSLDAVITCGGSDASAPVSVGFDGTGAMTTLRRRGHDWASPTNAIGRLVYNNYDADFFKTYFVDEYNIRPAGNFDKPKLKLPAINANATLTRLQVREDKDEKDHGGDHAGGGGGGSTSLLLHLTFPAQPHEERGAPEAADVLITVPHAPALSDPVELSVTVQWYNKTKTHAPETIWFSSRPVAPARDAWTMDKMGSDVNPLDANLTGAATCPSKTTCGVHLHAVGDGGVRYQPPAGEETPAASDGGGAGGGGGSGGGGGGGALTLRSLDSALVSIGAPGLAAPAPLVAPDPSLGVHFSLVNNIWNTNYPLVRDVVAVTRLLYRLVQCLKAVVVAVSGHHTSIS